jgi:hypothetical protein
MEIRGSLIFRPLFSQIRVFLYTLITTLNQYKCSDVILTRQFTAFAENRASVIRFTNRIIQTRLREVNLCFCKICGFRGGDYEEWCLLGCYATDVRCEEIPNSSQRTSVASCSLYCSQFTDSCHPDEGGARFLRNVGSYKSHTE